MNARGLRAPSRGADPTALEKLFRPHSGECEARGAAAMEQVGVQDSFDKGEDRLHARGLWIVWRELEPLRKRRRPNSIDAWKTRRRLSTRAGRPVELERSRAVAV